MFQLHDEERRLLLHIARKSVENHFRGLAAVMPEVPTGHLSDPCGTFVSLHKGSELRGCVGRVESEHPLFKTVSECSIAAATSDQRFTPVTPAELSELHFEISVLAPPVRTQLEDIRIGRDGLIVCSSEARGVLLPQVAERFGWSAAEFLEQTCRKAGLDCDAWRTHAEVYRFSAIVFGETLNS